MLAVLETTTSSSSYTRQWVRRVVLAQWENSPVKCVADQLSYSREKKTCMLVALGWSVLGGVPGSRSRALGVSVPVSL